MQREGDHDDGAEDPQLEEELPHQEVARQGGPGEVCGHLPLVVQFHEGPDGRRHRLDVSKVW